MFRLPPAAIPLIVISVALIAGAGWLLMSKQQQLEETQAALDAARQDVARLESEQLQLSQELKAGQNELRLRDERLASLRTQLAAATKELENSRAVVEELKLAHETAVREGELLQGQLTATTAERDEVRKRADRFEHSSEELQRSVIRLRERLALLDRDYQKLSGELRQAKAAPQPMLNIIGAAGPMTGNPASAQPPPAPIAQTVVELPPIVVRKDRAGMAIPVRGRVLEVNEPHGFLVVDKGSVDGVRVGMAFDILRGAEAVGRANVVRVRPQLSACDIVRAKTPGPVSAGDLAVQSGP